MGKKSKLASPETRSLAQKASKTAGAMGQAERAVFTDGACEKKIKLLENKRSSRWDRVVSAVFRVTEGCPRAGEL